MLSDIEIANQAKMLPIQQIAESLGLHSTECEPYGHYKAKIDLAAQQRLASHSDGQLILVTAINPTPAGEGKTTVTVGLGQAFAKLNKKAVIALREPSLGPVMGMKGGAAGGGYAQVVPMEDINLHFTGDMHAITSANNLLAALLDNHLQQGNALNIDPRQVEWKRVLDMNDRALRNITIGLGGKAHGIPREDHFMITVASEVMAILCLSTSVSDLKARLGRIIVAYTYDGKPITAADLQAHQAMTVLLRDAIKPNLVQTLENTPCLIHGGPFANIAHGCNSIIATKTALKLGDYVITEAGFGADLGAEKFMDIVCPTAGIQPAAVVIVATIRALKYNGGQDKAMLKEENLEALTQGIVNLERHIQNIRKYGVQPVVAMNIFATDSAAELDFLQQKAKELDVAIVPTRVFEKGGEAGIELAKMVIAAAEKKGAFQPITAKAKTVEERIATIAREIYRADGVDYSPKARAALKRLNDLGFGDFPVCMAKTQYSFSDQANLLGAPTGFRVMVRDLEIRAGAGFIVALMGDILTMPGLPKQPAAAKIDMNDHGVISGLF